MEDRLIERSKNGEFGKNISVCEVCGNKFEQLYITKQKRFTNFKKCGSCKTKKKMDAVDIDEVVNITLHYTPHQAQRKFHDSKARFRVLNCGSRFGKDRCTTMEAISYFVECLNENRSDDMIPTVYWWIVAPTETMAKQNWNELKRYFPRDLIVDLSNSGMMMQTVNGGLIEVRSAYDPESLVGVGLDIVTITEAARIADLETVWANLEQRLNSPGRGLNGAGGIGLINSSPKGRNYFYRMWTFGQSDFPDYDPDWESWTFTTWDNPEMDKRKNEIVMLRGRAVPYCDRLRARVGQRRYNQDILAQFTSSDANCFPSFYEKCVVLPPIDVEDRQKFVDNWQSPQSDGVYAVVYDPASINDIPAVEVFDELTGHLKRAYDMTGKSWNAQYNALTGIAKYYNHAPIIFSRTGHETIEEELVNRGNQCIIITEQGNKENLVTNLEGVVERGEFKVLHDGTELMDMVIRQHFDYSRKETRSGKVTFGNVQEPHDDFVSCSYIFFSVKSSPIDELPWIGAIGNVAKSG